MKTHCPTRREFVAVLAVGAAGATFPGAAAARPQPDAPQLLLAQNAPADIDPAGYLVSEKYDGARAVWDGSMLRFRSGARIAAPAWFTARLPATPLDGELWLGRGSFEALSGAVRRQQPDDAPWRALRYMIYELPGAGGDFAERATRIAALVRGLGSASLVAAPQQPVANRVALRQRLDDVVRGGGEGLVLHRADAPYLTGRSPALLKLKPVHDDEAVVIGHVAGRGRHLGRLGALRVRTAEGVEFLLGTGLSDLQRDDPPPIGAVVTFSYRGRTAAGVPRFASFLRLREV